MIFKIISVINNKSSRILIEILLISNIQSVSSVSKSGSFSQTLHLSKYVSMYILNSLKSKYIY